MSVSKKLDELGKKAKPAGNTAWNALKKIDRKVFPEFQPGYVPAAKHAPLGITSKCSHCGSGYSNANDAHYCCMSKKVSGRLPKVI